MQKICGSRSERHRRVEELLTLLVLRRNISIGILTSFQVVRGKGFALLGLYLSIRVFWYVMNRPAL